MHDWLPYIWAHGLTLLLLDEIINWLVHRISVSKGEPFDNTVWNGFLKTRPVEDEKEPLICYSDCRKEN